MIEKVTVIGLGSLGSYLSQDLCKTESIKEISIIDFDKVQESNLKLSPYKKEDVGKLKVDALEKLLVEGNKEVRVVKFNSKFEEGSVKLPESDLVLDCRDFTYDRKGGIDTRLSISSKYLLVDCRKNVSYRSGYTGMYPLDLERKDIIEAAAFAGSLVRRGLIEKMILKQKVYAVDLCYLDSLIKSNFGKVTEKNDILFDIPSVEVEKFTNLFECVDPIIHMNKLSKVTVCVGNMKFPESKKLFPARSLRTMTDVSSMLLSMIPPADYKNYIILVNDQKKYIELVPEQALA